MRKIVNVLNGRPLPKFKVQKSALSTFLHFVRVRATNQPFVKRADRAHREILLRNGVGKICLWKKFIVLCECIQKQGKRIFEIVHCPFELPPNQQQPTGPLGWQKWCCLAWLSKGQCKISKTLFPLILFTFIEQNVFFSRNMFCLYHF